MSAYWATYDERDGKGMDYDDDPGFDDDDYEDDLYGDCQMGADGYCGKAGSEECDFECPVMIDIHRAKAKRRAGKK